MSEGKEAGALHAKPEGGVRLRHLARVFLRIGATAYGGPAIVAQIRKAAVLDEGWLSEDEFAESLAFCQTLPGAIAVQTAAHVAWRLKGPLGALVATVAYVMPAFLLMLGLSWAYAVWGGVPWVVAALQGLRAVVVAIVLDSIVGMARPALKDWRGLLIAAAAAAALVAKAGALVVLLGSALISVPIFWGQAPPRGAEDAREPGRGYGWRAIAVILGAAACFLLFLVLSRWVHPALPALTATMAKVDLLAFGGGYTAVALMQDQVVRVHPWLTNTAFLDGLAMGQITPGPVILTATFIGYRVAGFAGAVMATAGIFIPSWLLLALLAPQFERIRGLAWVHCMVRGLLAAFVAMLVWVLMQLAGDALVGWRELLVAGAAFGALRLRISPLWVVGGGAIASVIPFLFR